jgi:glycosyltransferase involved in cell wall biosynthesis
VRTVRKMREIAPSSLPLVSVLMSVYNGERFLSQAIESILNQSFGDFEFIIIDDGSKDTTWGILTKAANQDARIRLLRNDSNLGLTKSLNMGLTLAKGAYIARQDADDIAQSMRLATQLALFEETPGLVITGSAYWVIDGNGQLLRIDRHPVDDTSIRWQMLFHNSFAHSSVMVRSDVLAAYSLSYNEECRYAQDYELWSRLLEYGTASNCKEPLVSYRQHDSNQRRGAYLEQQTIATRIAMTNVGKLGVQVSEQEMVNLRDLYLGRMTKNRSADMHNFSILILILTRFSKCKYVNRFELSFTRLHLFREVFRLKRSGTSGREIAKMAWEIISIDMWSFISAACLTALDKVGKI